MKTLLKLLSFGTVVFMASSLTACSNNDGPDEPDNTVTTTIGFKDAPASQFGSSSYGENLYNGEINKGYIARVYDDVYAQFPLNYGLNYDATFDLTWCYTFYNGGFALSNYHNMTEASYLNQLSVYNTTSPSGGNFVVAFGNINKADPMTGKYSNYAGCARVYLTDEQGYGVTDDEEAPVEGVSKTGQFKSVYMTNTTYTYLTMKNGDAYASALTAENEGWFKVQFIAFANDDPDAAPLAYTEAYLANFKKGQADGYMGIIDEWMQVDLSVLPECSILVINFVGSDTGDWGLNTPAYAAFDSFEISIEK